MEIHQLRYFVSIVETGSMSRAAGQCGVAQPSISQQLAKLEQEIGQPLFDRTPRRMSLTDAGRALLPRARRILREIHNIESNLEIETAGAVRVSIGAIPTIAPYVLPDALRRMRRALPDARLNVREDLTQNLIDALLDGEIDCAVVATAVTHDAIDTVSLGEEEFFAAVGADFEPPRDGQVGLPDLRGADVISLHEMHCMGQQVSMFCEMKRLRPRIVCRTTQLTTILELVSLGMGISLVPAMAVRADRSRRRQYLKLRGRPLVRPLNFIARKSQMRRPAIQTLVSCIRAVCEGG